MNIALWILQVVVGLAFIMAGVLKSTQPLDKLSQQMKWIPAFPPIFVRFIGVAELLGGIGLIVPAATGIAPWLTPVAAAGLAIIMVGAVVVHLQRKEYPNMGPTVVLFILAAFIVLGRVALQPL